jgi:hypothetical protein
LTNRPMRLDSVGIVDHLITPIQGAPHHAEAHHPEDPEGDQGPDA